MWQALAEGLLSILPGSPVVWLSASSITIGLICLGLIAWFNALSCPRHDRHARVGPSVTQYGLYSGILAMCFLGTFPSFWAAATRPGPWMFDAALFLGIGVIVGRSFAGCRVRHCVGLGGLCGIALAESPYTLVILPVATLYLLLSLTRSKKLNVRMLAAFGGTFLAVFSLLLTFFTWRDIDSVQAMAREVDSAGGMLWLTGRHYYLTLTEGIIDGGWLIVFLSTILPWFVVRAIIGELRSRKSGFGLFCIAILGIGLVLHLEYSPANILGQERYLVIPYLVTASWLGYLSGVVLFVLRQSYASSGSSRRKSKGSRRKARLFWAGAAGIPVALMVLCVVRLPSVDAERGAFVSEMARITVDQLPTRSVGFCHEIIVPHLCIAADLREKEVTSIALNKMSSRPYQRYMESLFETDRLKSLARTGPVPLIREILTSEDGARTVFVTNHSDMFYYAGFDPIPHGTHYGSGLGEKELSIEDLLASHRRLWDAFGTNLASAPQGEEGLVAGLVTMYRENLSKQANNLGVWLQDRDRSTESMEAYTRAREILPENLSALMNQYRLAVELESVQQKALLEEVEDLIRTMKRKRSVWELSSRYGYLRNPFFFRNLGMTWALSGQRANAIEQLEKASSLGLQGDRVRQMLGSMYMLEKNWEQSAKNFQTILDENPEHPVALIGMARLAMAQNDYASVETYLGRAGKAGIPYSQIRTELATLRLSMGRVEEAIAILEELTTSHPGELLPFALLANLEAQAGNPVEAGAYLSSTQFSQTTDHQILFLAAQAYHTMGDGEAMQLMMQRCLQAQPGFVPALESMARYLSSQKNLEGALYYAKQLLTHDPANFTANFSLGLHHQVNGERKLAKDAYVRCLKRNVTSPVLNNLAWLEQEMGNIDEAIDLSRQALAANANDRSAWDTLGYSLLKAGEYDEGTEALFKALEIDPQHLNVNLHILELFLVQNKENSASMLVDKLEDRLDEMSSAQVSLFEELRSRFNEMTEADG